MNGGHWEILHPPCSLKVNNSLAQVVASLVKKLLLHRRQRLKSGDGVATHWEPWDCLKWAVMSHLLAHSCRWVLTPQWEAVGDCESREVNEVCRGGTFTTLIRKSCFAFLAKHLDKYKETNYNVWCKMHPAPTIYSTFPPVPTNLLIGECTWNELPAGCSFATECSGAGMSASDYFWPRAGMLGPELLRIIESHPQPKLV